MPSPFPGMDPFLEESGLWRDFHQRFITVLADALLPVLPKDYDARSEEQIRLMEVLPGEQQEYRPDIGISKPRHPPSNLSGESGGGTAVLKRPAVAPVTIRTPRLVEQHDRWIEILRGKNRELVTVIEVLSPTNKAGKGLVDYQTKRLDLLSRGISLVEIDLLLGGERVAEVAEPLPAGDYYAVVSRAEKFGARGGECEIYGWSARDRLPVIAVPLKPPKADVAVSLAEVFNTTYDRGRYARALDYGGKPGKLDPSDQPWARKIVKAAGSAQR